MINSEYHKNKLTEQINKITKRNNELIESYNQLKQKTPTNPNNSNFKNQEPEKTTNDISTQTKESKIELKHTSVQTEKQKTAEQESQTDPINLKKQPHKEKSNSQNNEIESYKRKINNIETRLNKITLSKARIQSDLTKANQLLQTKLSNDKIKIENLEKKTKQLKIKIKKLNQREIKNKPVNTPSSNKHTIDKEEKETLLFANFLTQYTKTLEQPDNNQSPVMDFLFDTISEMLDCESLQDSQIKRNLLLSTMKTLLTLLTQNKKLTYDYHLTTLLIKDKSIIDSSNPLNEYLKSIIKSQEWNIFINSLNIFVAYDFLSDPKIESLIDCLILLSYSLIAEDFPLASNISSIFRNTRNIEEAIYSSIYDDTVLNIDQVICDLHLSITSISHLALYIADSIGRGRLWSKHSLTRSYSIIANISTLIDVVAITLKIVMIITDPDDAITFEIPDLTQDPEPIKLLKAKNTKLKEKLIDIERRIKLTNQFSTIKKTASQNIPEGLRLHLTEIEKPTPDIADNRSLDPESRFAVLDLISSFTTGDGHCLFHALLQGTQNLPNRAIARTPQAFIQELIAFGLTLQDEATDVQFSDDPESDRIMLQEIIVQLLDSQALTSPTQQENWGGQEILHLVSLFFNCPIMVILATGYLSGNETFTILFNPGEPVRYLNEAETHVRLYYEDAPNPVILGFLPGDPSGHGNHWFHVNYASSTSSDRESTVSDPPTNCSEVPTDQQQSDVFPDKLELQFDITQ